MVARGIKRPTDTELALLGVLWEHGPSTVREVHERLERDSVIGYTTVLKMLQIMTEKGLVVRDESARAHVYEAAASKNETQTRLVRDLVDRAFAGSSSQLVLRALATKPASAADLAELKRLIDEMSGEETE